ncbi:hypothetical protein [Melittangium boletus]|uniref:Uncharacterized protein n=1 Tax=Melittangium boletus DSM 14713 TaxID=1294270 RepID=A0A250IIL6_9BACT|nr:hypothetical protein [Melittangium boletus]ATB31664.1 hypothetical protein MEBOL_005127 [Melittangium boletus DSM 14713]
MPAPDSRPAPGLLARALKTVGRLTHPETRSGKVFTKAERGLTRVASRLAESPTFLRLSGGLMRRGLTLQVRRTSMMEKTLRSLRVPTASEVDGLRDQLRRMGDQVEALGSQLEHVVELLERQEPPPAAEPTPTRPARRRRASSSSR